MNREIDKIKLGDEVVTEDELRTVVSFPVNVRNEPLVSWKAKHTIGTCLPSVWLAWVEEEKKEELEFKSKRQKPKV